VLLTLLFSKNQNFEKVVEIEIIKMGINPVLN